MIHKVVDEMSEKIEQLPKFGDMQSVVLALEAGVELTEFNKKAYLGVLINQIKSVIPESLLYHVIREGQYGTSVLGQFLSQEKEELLPPGVCKL